MERISILILLCVAASFVPCEQKRLKCNKKLDLAVILDSSASLSDKEFETAKLFAKNLTRRFLLGKDHVRMSVVSFSHYIKIPFKFQDFFPEIRVFKAVDSFNHEGSVTRIGATLEALQNEVFVAKYGSRPKRKDVKRAIVIFTDGEGSSGFELAEMYAKPLKRNGVEIFVVGPKTKLNYHELKAIVSEPAESHIFPMKNSEDSQTIISALVNRLC